MAGHYGQGDSEVKLEIPESWYGAVDKYDDGVTVAAGRTIILPAPTPDQAAYLAMILAASNYDPRTIIGGPKAERKPGYCTEGRDCNCGGDTPEVRASCPNWISD